MQCIFLTAFKELSYHINYILQIINFLNYIFQMSYKVILFDRAGNASPPFPCDVHCNGSEIEIDAELSYDYINSSYKAHLLDQGEVISKHSILGYSFTGDTIINGVNASRCGQYILSISTAKHSL